MQNNAQLKPCPFCGDEFEVFHHADGCTTVRHPRSEELMQSCISDCPIDELEIWPDSLGDLVKQMNVRPSEDRLTARLVLAQKAASCALELIENMMPGVKHIALQDYAALNETPGLLREVIEGSA